MIKHVFSRYIDEGLLWIGNNCYVPVETFETLFATVSEPTFDAFAAADGGRLGYIPFFEKCRDEGVIQ